MPSKGHTYSIPRSFEPLHPVPRRCGWMKAQALHQHKTLGWWTSDNATTNDKAMKCLAEPGMACSNIVFWHAVEHCIHCSGHTINLTARAFIEAIVLTPASVLKCKLASSEAPPVKKSIFNNESEMDEDEWPDENEDEEAIIDKDTVEAVEYNIGDILGKAIAFVTQLRLSPQAHAFWARCCEQLGLGTLQLLKWVQTRWSSIYDLLTWLFKMKCAIDLFIALADNSLMYIIVIKCWNVNGALQSPICITRLS
ncbi:hypothetical protein M422DRAFT_248339 [Sphaerobolus stellatus SS14]|uniref:Uncharacterized protein n=1 Tax=Sphaerobolus stellatus (strain SS14) TaxID=990650 RepID=A0A0C9W4J3_SPHS4|nr:hypothetical protein M422DRAFT_248339 [Sphaerobolus stellatus SS14]